MANLDNITAKIIKDAENEKEKIINAAKDKGNKIINNRIKEGKTKKEQLIEKSDMEAKNRKERIISNSNLYVRNRKLEAKQQVIERVYKSVLDKLEVLPKDKYLQFVENSILNMDICGDEQIILSNKEKFIDKNFMDKINLELGKTNRKGNIAISNETREFKGGFILNKNGIEINNTFEALIDHVKDELQQNIMDIIFS